MTADRVRAFRGKILHCLGDPGAETDSDRSEYFADGLLVVEEGRVAGVGPAADLVRQLPGDMPVADYRGRWILPGFIDCHVHYPQIGIIGSFGVQLLDWLQSYTYREEQKFASERYARECAEFFLDELLKNGTTTALVFATSHPGSVDALFSAAAARRMRLISGKVLMDRHCPEALRDTPATGDRQSRELLERWHGRERLQYAITPRFAATSSPEQLLRAGKLAAEHPDVYVQTHLAENTAEVDWVRRLFPERAGYLDVYDHYGLVRERAVYAHCLHLNDAEIDRIAGVGAAIAFCPSSNLFLGSGLFDLGRASARNARIGLGTDVGAGTSLSQLRTVADAYKVLQLQHQALSACRALYLLTLGAARALYLDERLGNFRTGKEADFIILDPAATPLLERRCLQQRGPFDELFALMTLGDDRAVLETYLLGERVTCGGP